MSTQDSQQTKKGAHRLEIGKLRRFKMEVVYERCCGIDVHKNMLMVCIFTSVRKKEIREFGTMTEDIQQLAAWIKETNCQVAAMESTGVYWKPVYNILEGEGIELIVVNAQHIKAVPGRKTDVKDAEWIADLVRHGLVKASFVPNREQRELREMVRYRNEIVNERARELNRIQAVLEGANIKLSSVVTDISCKSSMAILHAIIDGKTNVEYLCTLVKGKLKDKINQIISLLVPMFVISYKKAEDLAYAMEARKNQEIALENAADVILKVGKEYEKISGRKYGFFEEYRTKDADYIMLIMGSAAGTAKQAVDELREQGKKVGVLKLRVFRPFPAKEIAAALSRCKAVAIMDRCESYNGNGGPLGSEVTAALYRNKVMIDAVNYIYGLAGRDFTVENVFDIFAQLDDAVTSGTEVEQYQYIGLRK